MKITTFNPMIITNHAEDIVSLFEALGFEKRHAPAGTSAIGNQYTDYRMTDANGFHVDIAGVGAPKPQDTIAIRMNVDDFDEAYAFLTERGFKPANAGAVTETGSSKGLGMVSPSGFMISLVKHIRKEDR